MKGRFSAENRQCRALFELASDAVFISSLEGEYLEVNERALEMLGYKIHELVGKSCKDIVLSCECPDELQKREVLLAGGNLPVYQRTFVRKDGGEIPAEVTAALVCDEEGNPLYIHSIVRDISERKNTELALEESQRKFRLFFESDSVYSYLISPEGHVLDINLSALITLGFKKEELIGASLIETVYSPSSRKKAGELFKRRKEAGKAKNEELNIITKNGDERTVFSRVDSVTTSNGEVLSFILIQRDITEKKRIEEKLFTICKLSNKMTLSLDFDEIISTALYIARRVIELRTAGITLIDEEKNELYIAGSYNVDRRVDDLRFPLKSEVGITAHVARTGEPYYSPDVSRDTLYLKVTPNIRSELAVPLKIGTRVLGVFDAESTEPDAFSDSDFLLLSILASQTAGALQNYSLFKEVSDLKDFNESIVKNIEEGILIEDSRGFVTFVNKAFEDMMGRVSEEIVGKHWKELPPKELVPRIEDEIERAPKGIKRRYESEIVRKDGERTLVAITAIPLFDDGGFRGVLSFFKDLGKRNES
ncbi:MAG: PAS domain S-box protein [Theionarchaea archaeon]|nr:PAS domain S-box protein [Theionarchaea archaeon]MBU7038824.1 PAS domain S-box protein [Theionarchaea archaeon]